MDSAHGNITTGVNRLDISTKGYSRGNCAHCHEQHSQIEGLEPAPVNGGPSAFSLFSNNYNTLASQPPYAESDNFCFYCHNNFGSVMQITNYNFSRTFGSYLGGALAVDSILDAFTPNAGDNHSQHNLYDVWNFSRNQFTYFIDQSNPCTACHNPHLAKQNKAHVTDPTFTAISKPSDHGNLWGDDLTERMDSHNTYQPPLVYNSSSTYEPGGTADHDGSNMPDYIDFCTDCHNNTNTIWSTALGRNLEKFNWNIEKHGGGSATNDNGVDVISPYTDTSLGQYVLSCTDCHEPHGSSNNFLVRTAVNRLEVTIPGGRGDWRDLCATCHSAIPAKHHTITPGDCAMQCHYQEWNPDINAIDTVYRECIVCHFHGNTKIYNGTTQMYETYNGGEHLF